LKNISIKDKIMERKKMPHRYYLRSREKTSVDPVEDDDRNDDFEEDDVYTESAENESEVDSPRRPRRHVKSMQRLSPEPTESLESSDVSVPSERPSRKRQHLTESQRRLRPRKDISYSTDSHDDESDLEREDTLRSLIRQRLESLGVDLNPDDLKTAIDVSLKKAAEDLAEGKLNGSILAEDWKKELPKTAVDELTPIMQRIKINIDESTPTLEKILRAQIPFEDKCRAVELFDILQSTEASTEDYLRIRDKIVALLRHEVSPEVLTEIEAKEAEFKKKITVPHTTFELKKQILELDADDAIKAAIYEKYLKLQRLEPTDAEYRNTREWINWAVSLPYRKVKTSALMPQSRTPEDINAFCAQVYAKLDAKLYGMKKVKEDLIQILAMRLMNPNAIGCALALCGIPGCGKTAVAQALGEAIGEPVEILSMGGMEDPSILKGMDDAWVGATPSIILQILKKLKSSSGIVVIDEIDKLGETEKGKQVQYALLHISDYTQNKTFRDNYLSEIPHDLSRIWFLYTMNHKEWLDPTLRDRLPILDVPGYNHTEKIEIATKYVLPAELKNVGLQPEDVTFTEDGINRLLQQLSTEIRLSGIRPIQTEIRKMVGRINLLRLVTLSDGTTGSLKLSFAIPNFKLPMTLDATLVRKLCTEEKKSEQLSYYI
jgi:ATP-dependent Lon protease